MSSLHIIEQSADTGFAVQRNGTILLRTASDSEWQAMGNGLVLVFNADPQVIDWAFPNKIQKAWEHCVCCSGEELEIVACQVVALGDPT